MADTLKVIAKSTTDASVKTFDVTPKGTAPTRIAAEKGVRYEFQDPALNNRGPANLRAKRVGKDLSIAFGDSAQADVVIEGFYNPEILANNPAIVYGRGPDGLLYEYLPQDSGLTGMTESLVDGASPVSQVMGGNAVAGLVAVEVGALLPVAAAFSPLAAVAVGVGVAAAAGGGGSGTSGPSAAKVTLDQATAAATTAAAAANAAATAATAAKTALDSAVAALGTPATPAQLADVETKQAAAIAAASDANTKAAAATTAVTAASAAAAAANETVPASVATATAAATAATSAATAATNAATASETATDAKVATLATAASTAATAANTAATAATAAKTALDAAVAALGTPATPTQLADVETKQAAAIAAATDANTKAAAATAAASAANAAAIAANETVPASVATANAAATAASNAATAANTAATTSETATDAKVATLATAATTAATAANTAATAATSAKTALDAAVAALGTPATPAQLADVETKQAAAIAGATDANTKAAAATAAATAASAAAVAANETVPASVATANAAATAATSAATAANTAATTSETATDAKVATLATAASTAATAANTAATAATSAKTALDAAVAALGTPATPAQLADVETKQAAAIAAATDANTKAAAATAAATAASAAAVAANETVPASVATANAAATTASNAATAANTAATTSETATDAKVATLATAATTAATAANTAATAATSAKTALDAAVAALGTPATPAQLADVETKQAAAIAGATDANTKAAAATAAASAANAAAIAANETVPASVATANAAATAASNAATAATNAATASETATDAKVANLATAASDAATAANLAATAANDAKTALDAAVAALGTPATPTQLADVETKQAATTTAATAASAAATAATAAATAAANAAAAANETVSASVATATAAATAATSAATAANTAATASETATDAKVATLATAAADAATAANLAATAANDAKTALDAAVAALGTPATPTQLADVETKQAAATTAATAASAAATAATAAATAAANAAAAANETVPASVATATAAATAATTAATATALDVISSAAQANNATDTAITAGVYALAGVTNVDASNLGAINSALNGAYVTGAKAASVTDIQVIVTAYNKVLAEANGSSPNVPSVDTPQLSDYVLLGADLGVATTTPANYLLFSDIVANSNSTGVNTIAKINDLARIANAIQLTAAGGTPSLALTTADLQAIGITNAGSLNATQLSNFLRLVADKVNDGSATDSLSELQTIANGDLTSPTATLTSTGSLAVTTNASVSSSETGTAYLVDSTVTVSTLSDILALADSQYNSVTITTASTATNLALAGLATGTYKLYTVDAAGNLSAGTSNAITTFQAVSLAAVAAGTGGFMINGQSASDSSGWSVSNAGDVNGDGLTDLIVGASGANTNTGKSYVVFGRTGTTAIDLSAVEAGTGGFVINGQAANDRSGRTVSNAGDVNGDGLADLIVGASGANTNTGKSYVVFGRTGTTAIDLSAVEADTGGFVINGPASSQSGYTVSNAGDFNGDGLADLLVGTVNGSKNYVVFGQTGSTAINLAALGTAGFVINASVGGGVLYTVSTAGDVNGDSLADVIVGDYSVNKAYVVFGQTGTTAINVTALGTAGFEVHGSGATGSSVSNAGDVNGDGLADLMVSAANISKSYVVFGQTGSTTIELTSLGSSGFVILGSGVDSLGYSVSNAGDVNGDGLADLIVGAPGTSTSAGKTYVVFGKTDTAAINITALAVGSGGFVISGASSSDLSGQSVSAAGDVNGDGFVDLIVGAQAAAAGGLAGAGKSYVIFGGPQFAPSLNPVDFIGTTGDDGLNVTTTTTNMAETFMAGDGDDTLVGGGGADVMNGGKGNDTLVLTTTNITALTSAWGAGGNTAQLSRVDGGTGFDTLRLASGSGNLDLTAVSNVDAMSGSGTSRITSIERIDLATDATANILSLKAQDVNDMAGMNVIHLGTKSADGNFWVNVTNTPLSATTQFHQVLVDGGANDVVNLKTGLVGTWALVGKVNSSSSDFDVYQNTLAKAQVFIKSPATTGVTVNLNVAPVVLDLNGDGQLSYSHTVMDVNGDGHLDNTAWAGPQDGVLVWDKYHDGQVHDHSQYAFTQYGGDTDLQGLAAAFDTNRDGELNAQDSKFAEFKVWQDINQDGVSDAGEVRSLADWGVSSIHLVSDGVQRTPAAGVTEAGRTTASTVSGQQMLVADVAFDFSSVIAQHANTAPVPVSVLGTGSPVVTINLHDVLQGESSSPTHSHAFYSAATTTATTSGFFGSGGTAQWLLDQQMSLNHLG